MGQIVNVNNIPIGEKKPLVLIAGLCVMETEETTWNTAKELKKIAANAGMPFISKFSYDKANRTNPGGYRGPGLKDGLAVIEKIKRDLNVAVTADVHKEEEIGPAAKVLDLLQIPALIFKQMDLVMACGRSKKPVNIKKGQFAAPWEVKNVLDSLKLEGFNQLVVTERGTFFGYNVFVNDFRCFDILRTYGQPVIFDPSHAVIAPAFVGEKFGANRNYIPTLCKAGVAAGADGIFLEVHPEPPKAMSNPDGSFELEKMEQLLKELVAIAKVVRG